MWDLTSLHLLQTKHEMPVKVWMLAFSFPFVMVVGGEDWAGLKVFHVTTGELVRDIKASARLLRTIHPEILPLSE